jgi:uncharacterized protein YbjT (DUF2867 family)
MKNLKIVLTGATGMVGEGVLHECLSHPSVSEVLVVGRKACGKVHPKLKEIIQDDFFRLENLQGQIAGYDACLFCLGVSSVGMNEQQFTRLTHTLTLNFAGMLSRDNPEMTFCYISGSATDSTEKGRIMWARVKGRTENDLKKLPFKAVYNFRPGYMQPTPGMRNTLVYYKYISWMYPLFKIVFPRFACRLSDLGKAMIQVCLHGYQKNEIEVPDIVKLAE